MSGARVHEQGYRRYDGPRAGVGNAIQSTYLQALRFILGLRRRARSKVLPWGVLILASLPALGFVGVVAIIPAEILDLAGEILPGPEVYLGGISLLVYLGAAIAGPTALCEDRRSGMLRLYLASPLTRDTYLLSRAAAVFTFLAAATTVPPLVYVLGTMLVGDVRDRSPLLDVAGVVSSGIAVALLVTALSCLAAALTERQATASVSLIGFLLLSGIVVNVVVNALELPEWARMIDVNQVAFGTVDALFGGDGLGASAPVALGACALWTLVAAAVVRWRYQRMEVW